ncbi:bifunctional diaminohydroxyphosphoribosylaminopyrimidine deaminase/5-amino-6-(5-phosphoribosylamino)uracil reductase RibD [Streptomyces odonnellii]|uniref:bifunctional diaminohydroxyphosphoribosylaminopyrimidine deaminase/5-amino-6-(5-phosphoribosylamino)uracil reductase RibD n=1 Tax=Streptomyces odonnellii TaxID=1417980 RepID=UPI00099CEA43|nr:bifunctional diaminohydroxyphosphoribosylaminopyrimidine deaminase/5-amino-6-(5-phosphoribosylamino)uracil reductase RibD [Streptomyces odonnellii]
MTAYEMAAMRRAIAISAQGLGSTSPNPPVGCVILDSDGRTVGEGYHVRKGEPHAEVNALTAAGKRATGGTAVVTLEPCNHYGRTPPCREALINANVARVLIAVMDPTSRGEGGAALLKRAGVEVEHGFLEDEALLVLGPWRASLQGDRPFITWIYEADADGNPSPRPAQGIAFEEMNALRSSHDLVIDQKGVEEGRVGSHGNDVFRIPRRPLDGNAAELVRTLSETGARSVLLSGVIDELSPITSAGVVDQVIAYLPRTPHSWLPETDSAHIVAVPNGYRLTEVTRRAAYVRLVGHRTR